jgi:hypothetical protein
VEGLARDTACRAVGQIGESGPPRTTDVRKGSLTGHGGGTRQGQNADSGRDIVASGSQLPERSVRLRSADPRLLLSDADSLLRWSWGLGVDGLAPGQHLDKPLDALRSGFGLLRASDPEKDGVPVRARERLKHRLRTRIGNQRVREVLWNFHPGLPGVGGIPSTIFSRLLPSFSPDRCIRPEVVSLSTMATFR